ncbi:Hypothetical predicted protein [Octopus vulgaris]|uniref:Tc1-like transposase DDE domain-containing protein n=1 Tax=Octopus vulgaris TaxID=6645 RepID=A0AA36AKZ4_OCTVU|nr:Hypothetical predicted protein [Octopus vulgaris]
MEWSPSSPDLNPIENLWSIAKQKLYERGKQYNSKVELWNDVQSIIAAVSPDQIGKLTNSMDNSLVTLFEKKGRYINMHLNHEIPPDSSSSNPTIIPNLFFKLHLMILAGWRSMQSSDVLEFLRKINDIGTKMTEKYECKKKICLTSQVSLMKNIRKDIRLFCDIGYRK